MERLNYVSWAQMHQDVVALMQMIHAEQIVGVIGVPRSGMIPASHLAVMMGLPLMSVHAFASGESFTVDSFSRVHGRVREAGPVLLLEDSVNTGRSLQQHVRWLGGDNLSTRFRVGDYTVIPAALYTADTSPMYSVRKVPHPRIFAWNWSDSWITGEAMFDIDGVICADPVVFDDNAGHYIDEIGGLAPRYLTRRPIRAFCTNRLERFRKETDAYLTKWGIRYDTLLMRPEKTAAERRAAGPYGKWKGERYRDSGLKLFVESDRDQAGLIFKMTGKPVLCTDADKMFSR